MQEHRIIHILWCCYKAINWTHLHCGALVRGHFGDWQSELDRHYYCPMMQSVHKVTNPCSLLIWPKLRGLNNLLETWAACLFGDLDFQSMINRAWPHSSKACFVFRGGLQGAGLAPLLHRSPAPLHPWQHWPFTKKFPLIREARFQKPGRPQCLAHRPTFFHLHEWLQLCGMLWTWQRPSEHPKTLQNMSNQTKLI